MATGVQSRRAHVGTAQLPKRRGATAQADRNTPERRFAARPRGTVWAGSSAATLAARMLDRSTRSIVYATAGAAAVLYLLLFGLR